jgi:hypothetical protein
MAINFPNTPSNGDTHAVGEMIFTYDAVKNSWTPLSAASGASVIVSDTPPSSPSSGDLWTDSTTMKMFIYYEDADSSQWVEVSGSSGGGSGASGSTGGSGVTMESTDPLITNNGTLGELWLNTTSGELYACTDITTDDNIWINIGDGTGNITSNVPPGNPTNTTIAQKLHNSTFSHTFTGGTDTDGTVTHYIVDEITGTASGNVVSNPMTVALPEVPVGIPHQFTIPILANGTTISFRVRSKDNSGSYSSGVTVTFNGVTFYTTGGVEEIYSVDGITYKSHTFLTSGDLGTLNGSPSGITVDYLMVAGGGAGGADYGGGGGAGGLIYQTGISLSPDTYTVTIGAGGSSVIPNNRGGLGGDTTFNGLLASGGGGGGGEGQSGNNGGSGGGGSYNTSATSSIQNSYGGTGFGSAGGATTYGSPNYNACGGGGAGASGLGGNASVSGDGGIGKQYSLPNPTYYAGGGGGGFTHNGSGQAGVGGLGGGGTGGLTQHGDGADGVDNTGGGGGGGGGDSYDASSGSGGSGIVIIRYAI